LSSNTRIGSPRAELEQFAANFLAIGQQRLVAVILAQHGQDDDLMRGNRGRNAQPVIVAMGHDDAADHAGRHAPAGRMRQFLRAFLALITDARRLGKPVPR
jgi:hypothetical protein